MEQDICQKCKKFTYVEKHHVLPKSIFGETKETAKLCPNCHTEYHQHLGTGNLKNEDMVFHFYTFYKWLSGLVVVLGLLIWYMLKSA